MYSPSEIREVLDRGDWLQPTQTHIDVLDIKYRKDRQSHSVTWEPGLGDVSLLPYLSDVRAIQWLSHLNWISIWQLCFAGNLRQSTSEGIVSKASAYWRPQKFGWTTTYSSFITSKVDPRVSGFTNLDHLPGHLSRNRKDIWCMISKVWSSHGYVACQ